MFVKEAIALLEQANPEAVLILSKDEEGNEYREADVSIDESFYRDSDGNLESIHPDASPEEYAPAQPFSAVVVW